MTEAPLPEAFADLAPFAEWALPTEEGRHRKKVASYLEEARAFYGAVFPRMEAIIDYLNTREWETLGGADRTLYFLACALMEVSHPIELGWKTTDIADAFPTDRVQFLSESAGYRAGSS
jgi:hypothetical protein